MHPLKDPKSLAEEEAKPLALEWIASSIAGLERFAGARSCTPGHEIILAALAVNFAWERVPASKQAARARRILGSYRRVREVLHGSARRFQGVSEAEARRLFPEPAAVPPAYAIYKERIYFTPGFACFGPKCRAAMVLHEAVHIFDRRSGQPDIHISEWDEPRFSSLTPDQAIHNPSAYASFAAQVHHERLEWPRGVRFGAGRPDD